MSDHPNCVEVTPYPDTFKIEKLDYIIILCKIWKHLNLEEKYRKSPQNYTENFSKFIKHSLTLTLSQKCYYHFLMSKNKDFSQTFWSWSCTLI